MAVHSDAPFLPEEVMVNILKRLPVKSLIQFQCVCKSWRNLFKTPAFISNHLRYWSLQNSCLLLTQKNFTPLHLKLIDCCEMRAVEVQNPPVIDSLPYVSFIGSCNGLLCLATGCNSFLVWNPAIRRVRNIPKTRTVQFSDNNVGFGFSAIINDFKIVIAYASLQGVVSRIEAYSLGTGLWKEIEFGSLKNVRLCNGTVTANGCIFWQGKKKPAIEEEGKDHIGLIVSFDMATEVFTLIPRPFLSDSSGSKLIVYEDKVAIISFSGIGDFSCHPHYLIDLWVLEELKDSSEERWCWINISKSIPRTCLFDGLPTIWRDEIVCCSFRKRMNTNEIEYDEKVGLHLINVVIANKRKGFVIPGLHLGKIFNHVESLIPVLNICPEERSS